MNVDQDDFHITLFSDASKDIYTLNSRTSFTNRLALPVDLGSTSEWIVGLAEIGYKPPERAYVNGVDVTPIGTDNIFVYCDVVTPQLVGSEIRSVLRTIVATSRTGHHTFPNIYYLPVKKKILTYVHIEMAYGDDSRNKEFLDGDGDGGAPTTVVLHFKRTTCELTPFGVKPCPTFQVDKILDQRSTRGITEELIQWKGWDQSYNSWFPRSYIQEYY